MRRATFNQLYQRSYILLTEHRGYFHALLVALPEELGYNESARKNRYTSCTYLYKHSVHQGGQLSDSRHPPEILLRTYYRYSGS